jgi:hypothetical protein
MAVHVALCSLKFPAQLHQLPGKRVEQRGLCHLVPPGLFQRSLRLRDQVS